MINADDFAQAARSLEPRALERVAGPHIKHAIDRSGSVIRDQVRSAARRHRRTGRLEGQITAKSTGTGFGAEATVHAGGPVAHLIVGGTAPHEISPVRSRAIAMTRVGGELVGFAGAVHHPGTRADPFVARGVAAAERDVARIVNAAGDAITADLAHHMTSRRP